MKLPTLLSLSCIFSLLLSGGSLWAAQLDDEPFTSKFQNACPDGEEGPESFGGKRGPDFDPAQENKRGRGGQEMSDEDRQRMKTIQEKLSKNPEVQKAREQMENAQTPEEHQEAMKNMRKVMDKALGAEDRAFMEKMRKQKQSGGMKQKQRRGQPGEDGFPGVPPEFGGERGGEQGGSGSGPSRRRGGGGGGQEFGEDSRGQRGPGGPGGFGGGGGEQGRPQLTDEQRTRLKSIRAKYKDDPEVKAAREAVKEAITPEERELAIDDYRETVRKKLSAEDRQFLDEFRQNRMQQRPTQAPPGGERF